LEFLPIYLEAHGGVSGLDSLSAERPEKLEKYSRIFYEDNNINKGTINCRTYWKVPEYSKHSFAQSMYSFAQSE
jgi:hypothetical protein